MNNKGFTMVELLVAMAIMGLLVIMAFPTLRAIQLNNTDRKYKEYGTAAISATKLYTDSYADDMFNYEDTNQFKMVTFDKLVLKDLLKEIGISGAYCVDSSSVTVVKYDNDYSYCLHLKCTTKDGSTTLYEEKNTRGSCAKFETAHVTYKARINNVDYKIEKEVVVGEDNLKTLTEAETKFPFASNHLNLDSWESNDSEIGTVEPGKKIGHPINKSIIFNANTSKYKYYVKYTHNLTGVSGNMTRKECTYGNPCVLDPNAFSKEYYSFDEWRTDSGVAVDDKDNLDEYISSGAIKITYNNQEVKLNAKFRKNTVHIDYNSNGGDLDPDHNSAIKLNAEDMILKNSSLIEHNLTFDQKLGDTGLLDWNNKNYCNLKRKGFIVENGKEWNTKANGTGSTFNQTTAYTAKELCPAIKTGDCDLTMHVNWKIDPSTQGITCAPGKYLPKNKTSCAKCKEKYYCLGGVFIKKAKDQGLTPCPTGYKNSKAGSDEKTDCYMNVSKDHHVKKAKDKKETKCSDNYGKKAHKVYYGKKSSCVKEPSCSISPSSKPNAYGWYNKNVTITLKKSGGTADKYGLSTSKKSTNEKTSLEVKKEGKNMKYYGYVHNEAGSDTCEISISLDKTKPVYIDKDNYLNTKYYINEWVMYWQDVLSGLSNAQYGDYEKSSIDRASYVLYCYGTSSSCSRFCTTNYNSAYHGAGGNNYEGKLKGIEGFWLRKAVIADNFDGCPDPSKICKLVMQTSRGCNGGHYTVKVEAHVCDLAENCSEKYLTYTF